MRLFVLFTLSVFSISCISQTGNTEDDYKTAAAYYKQGDYMNAFRYYMSVAKAGDANAQNDVGNMYYHGNGVAKSYTNAYQWYLKAANQDHYFAQNHLGDLFYYGNGIKQDYMKAFEWYSKAAEQGYDEAQFNLGILYENGYGVKRDYLKAYEWYLKAAEQGYNDAQVNLGDLFYYGNGVKQDYMKAFEWYSKAAEQGYNEAQFSLGDLFYNGYGVKQDYLKAYEWFSKAAEQGNKDAQYCLGVLYNDGDGVQQDYMKAYECYLKAAESGDWKPQYCIGRLFLNGQGVKMDLNKAEMWFKKSIESNKDNPYSYSRIGLIYALRDKDFEKALKNSDIALSCKEINHAEKKQIAKIYGTRGHIFYLKGDMKNSEKMLEKSLEYDSDYLNNDDAFAKIMAKKISEKDQIKKITDIQSDIDSVIFVNPITNKNTFAVIIGNEKYKHEADVPFAENDAKIFKEYVQKTLGVPEKQIKFVKNASLNEIRIAIRWLKQAMDICGGQGKAIFYYAGHGIPDEANKTALLLPTDGIGSDPESAYSLQRLYDEFNNMQTQLATVFLDACFSGSKREGDMMVSARGVTIDVNPMIPKGKTIVFTAAQGDQTAYSFKERQHGMFTYFLLKKLQESKGNITLGELSDYLTKEVKRVSFVENNKVQTPTVKPSAAFANSWRDMKLISD